MSFDPRNPGPRGQGPSRPTPPSGSQGASRGGRPPDDRPGNDADSDTYYWNTSTTQRGGSSRGGGSRTFLGIPVTLVYLIGACVIGLVFIGAVCSRSVSNGSVAGQVKGLDADHQVATVPGAQVILRGSKDTYTTVSGDAPADAEGDAAYNYHFENVPPGTYTMAVTPPAGSDYQPESDITVKVESGELYPQSVLLLAQGIQKPRPLAPSEMEPGQVGYINDRGERVVYQQGSGFDATDALLLYLLWRNPPAYGYGAPPIIYNPGGSTTSSSNYRVSPPPSTSRSGQTVTQRPPSVPGQGSTRPSASGASSGPGPSVNSGSNSSSSSSSTTTRPSQPSTSSSSSSSNPSQGATRPSSSSSSSAPSRSPSSSSRSSGGGRR
jgi:hypothetical protein